MGDILAYQAGHFFTVSGYSRHLASWPQGSKRVITKDAPVYFQIPPESGHYLFLRTTLLEGPSLLRNNLVLLKRIEMPSCLRVFSDETHQGQQKTEQKRNVWYSLNPFLMNPSIKTPELTIQGSSQKIELHICKSTSRKKFCQEATSSARPTVQALNLEIEGIHINSNYNLSLA